MSFNIKCKKQIKIIFLEKTLVAKVFVMFLLLLVSCSENNDFCTENSDCSGEKICSLGACVYKTDGDAYDTDQNVHSEEQDGDIEDLDYTEQELDEYSEGSEPDMDEEFKNEGIDGDFEQEYEQIESSDQEYKDSIEENEISEKDEEITTPIVWKSIPSGSFKMGCTSIDTECEDREKPQHTVNIETFELTAHEITQDQYLSVMGYNPSHFKNCEEACPVENVDWNNASEFCRKIKGRLPSEAEWEYAARAGKDQVWSCGDAETCLDNIAWYGQNSKDKTHEVGLKKPNSFGVFDMTGNVNEWTADCIHENYSNAPSDGNVWAGGDCTGRMVRGGDWETNNSLYFRISYRGAVGVNSKGLKLGFRCVKGSTITDGDYDLEKEIDIQETEEEKEYEIEITEQEIGSSEAQATLSWINIPSGSYTMGCALNDDNCNGSEYPRHLVNIEKIKMLKTEVTQKQYFAINSINPSHFKQCGDNCPVEMVSWSEAQSFCNSIGGRLPTEAEWEYAARSNTNTILYCGDSYDCLNSIAWYGKNSDGTTHSVGGKKENNWGFKDMIGNVHEWVLDEWHSNYNGAPNTGEVWVDDDTETKGPFVARGGFWMFNQEKFFRISYRSHFSNEEKYNFLGFRCVKP